MRWGYPRLDPERQAVLVKMLPSEKIKSEQTQQFMRDAIIGRLENARSVEVLE
jgi:hypothetical protein